MRLCTRFLERLAEKEIAFLVADGSYFRVRDSARYVPEALFLIACI